MELREIESIIAKNKVNEEMEQALRGLYVQQFNQFNIVSLVDVIMNYITINEILEEQAANKQLETETILKETYRLIKENIQNIDHITCDKAEKVIYSDKLRKAKEEMENYIHVLVAYNDLIELYEGILSKIVGVNVKEQDNEQLAGDMVSFVFQDQDKMLINSRMKDLLKILPVRMTKAKMNDYIRESMSIYYGGYEKSLNDFMKIVKETYAPESVSGFGDFYKEDISTFTSLQQLDYSQLSEVEAKEYLTSLEEFSTTLDLGLSIGSSLVEIINKLIILFIGPSFNLAELAVMEPKLENAIRILDNIKEDKGLGYEAIVDNLEGLEGVVEEWLLAINQFEGAVDRVMTDKKDILKSLMLDGKYHNLKRAKTLLSNSLFAEIDPVSEQNNVQVDKSILHEKINQLIEFINEAYEGLSKEIRRGKVSQLLYTLPVAFLRPQDLFDYIMLATSAANGNEKGYLLNQYNQLKMEYK